MSKNGKTRVTTNQFALSRMPAEDAAYVIKHVYISNSYMRDSATAIKNITDWLRAEYDAKAVNDILKKMKDGE